MGSSLHFLIITSVLFLLVIQINGGYWICDWVSGRGWIYCSRGYCNTFGKKRSISLIDEDRGPLQNHDGTYCLNGEFCYTCEPINDYACRITLKPNYLLTNKLHSNKKRGDEDYCP